MYFSIHMINRKRQTGSALVIAIFVLVVMTLLGSALIRMQSSSAETVIYEVMGTRAYAAAQVGIQWQLTEIFPLDETNAIECKPDPNIGKPAINGVAGLEGCWFNIQCDDDIAHVNVQYYTITSTGSCDVGGIETSRTIEIEARSIN